MQYPAAISVTNGPKGGLPSVIMGILLIKLPFRREIGWMRRSSRIVILLMALEVGRTGAQAGPAYTIEEAVAVAKKQNPEILMAGKQIEAARGGVIEARAGFLPGKGSARNLRDCGRKTTLLRFASCKTFTLAGRSRANWPSRG
jgi:hypothetical protein